MLMARLHELLVRLTALVPEFMFGAAMAWVVAPIAIGLWSACEP